MKKTTLRFTIAAMLAALTFVLGMTPIGIIPIPPANVTIMHIPVIIGTLVCGLKTGLLLGGVFGLTSSIRAFTAPSALIAPVMGVSPILAIFISVASRLMIPVVTYFVNKLISKKSDKIAVPVASALGTITNTVCYLGLMLLTYVSFGIDSTTLLSVIGGVGALNGSCEAAAAVIICTPVVFAVRKFLGSRLG